MAQTHCHVRSNSMPCRSHPNTIKTEDALNKLKFLESSLKAEMVSTRLNCLVDLYHCVEDLLRSPVTQQALVKYRQQEKWVEDLLDGSVRVLDVCTTARDVLLQLKEQTQDLQAGLRKRGGESAREDMIGVYMRFRKQMKKVVSKCLGELKRMNNKSPSTLSPLNQDRNLRMVIKVLEEVKEVTISFFESFMSFLYSSPTPQSQRWSFVSKLKHKTQVACDDEDLSELQCIYFALHSISHSSKDAKLENIEKAKERLGAIETRFEGLESGLECLFKRLIQSRVSLLNIFTQ